MTKHVVTAPYVTLKMKDQAGATVLGEFYQGAPVPDTADPENVQRLVDKGMIAVVGTPQADLLGVPAGTPIPGEPPNVAVTEQPVASLPLAERLRRQREAAEGSEDQQEPAGPPRRNASHADWVAYAVSQRADGVSEEQARADAEPKARDELIAEYGD
jgi:hypothetical protein